MKHTFRYRFSRKTLYLSAFYIAILVLIGVGLHQLYIGGYLSAWFLSLVGALVALMALSIPRKIVVKPATVEILCLLDMTEIPRMEIASVQRADTHQMRWIIPLLGSYGFFGYYGYYLDLKNFEKVIVYASEWKNLVEIEDIYEQRYYVSCTDADELIALLQPSDTLAASQNEDTQDEED